MPVSKQIELKAKKDIVDAINNVIDRWMKDGLSIKEITKYLKQKSVMYYLMIDINKAGSRFFESEKQYKDYVRTLLHEILHDRKSEIETMELQKENKIIKFSEFDIQNEGVDYKDLTSEYLFNDIGFANDDMDILAQFFKTKEDYIEVKDKNYCVYSITDFNTDILKNNRVKMDVLLLANFQLEKMKDNVTRKIINGIYEQIPQEVQYMGILVKPHTILDKQKLKESVDTIVDKNIVSIVSNVTKYEYVQEYGDGYHIWKKVK